MKKSNKDSLKKRNQKAFKNKVKRKKIASKNKAGYIDLESSLKSKGAVQTLIDLASKTPNKSFGKGDVKLTIGDVRKELIEHYNTMMVASGVSEVLKHLAEKGEFKGELNQVVENNLDTAVFDVNDYITKFDEMLNEQDLPDDKLLTQDQLYPLLSYMDNIVIIATYLEDLSKEDGLLTLNKDRYEEVLSKIYKNLEKAKQGNNNIFLNPYVYLFQTKLSRLEREHKELKENAEKLQTELDKFESDPIEDIDVDNTLTIDGEHNEQ